MKFILALALLFGGYAQAATTYFCSCGAGAEGDCSPGVEGAAGTQSNPKLTLAEFTTAFAAAVAGDQLLLCKGGAWNDWNLNSKATTSTLTQYIANPLIIDSFSPTTFTGSAKPLLNIKSVGCTGFDDDTCAAFVFTSSSGWGTTRWGGYIIRNLAIDGASAVYTRGVSLFRTPQNIALESLTITNAATAVGCSGQAAYGWPSNVAYRNLTISNIRNNGMTAFGCSNLVVEGNTLDNTANGAMNTTNKIRDHAMYISANGEGSVTRGVVIRNNIITNTGYGINDVVPDASAKCATTVIVGHGEISNWVIENNTIKQATGKSIGYCYGIAMAPGNNDGGTEYEKQLVIRGNRLINLGNIAIDTQACQNCTIENNVVVQENVWDSFIGIRVSQMGFAPTTNNLNVTVRNNSFYLYGATDVSTAFSVGGSGTGHVVTGNLVYFGAGGHAASYCFGADLSAASYATWDNNLCYGFSGWTSGYATKALFSDGRSGHDTNGVSGDPLVSTPSFANNGRMQLLQSTSPARNAGHATKSSRLAIDGYPKVGTRDIGAFEFGSNP